MGGHQRDYCSYILIGWPVHHFYPSMEERTRSRPTAASSDPFPRDGRVPGIILLTVPNLYSRDSCQHA